MNRGHKKGIKFRKKENIKRFFYPKEWNTFYASVPSNLKFYYNLLIQTGARYNELKHIEVRDLDNERKNILLRHTKTRTGGLKRLKTICPKCNIKINLTKTLRFCNYCGNEFTNIDELMLIYKDKITDRRREQRRVKISNNFHNEITNYIKEKKLKSTDTFNLPTIQHLNQTLKRILCKINANSPENFSDWKDFSIHNIRKTTENYLLATGSNPTSMRFQMGHSIDVAVGHYLSNNLFTPEEMTMIKIIMDDLKI